MSKHVVDLRKRKSGDTPRSKPLPLPSYRKRRESLRVRRRRARLAISGVSAVLALVLFGLMSYASYLPRFNVQTIEVAGAEHVAPDDISHYVNSILHDGTWHMLSTSNIFLYRPKLLEREIFAQFPRIKHVHVHRTAMFATTVRVDIEERRPFATWCKDARFGLTASSTEHGCYLIDEAGFIFAPKKSEDKPESIVTRYIFEGGLAASTTPADPVRLTFAPSHLPGMLALLQYLFEEGLTPIGARVEGERDFFVFLREGFYIKASFGAHAEDLARTVSLILESEPLKGQRDQIEYIDLRFGNRVYFKLKGEAEAAAE